MGYGYNGREHCIGSARHGWDGYTPAYLVLFLRFLLFFFTLSDWDGILDAWMPLGAGVGGGGRLFRGLGLDLFLPCLRLGEEGQPSVRRWPEGGDTAACSLGRAWHGMAVWYGNRDRRYMVSSQHRFSVSLLLFLSDFFFVFFRSAINSTAGMGHTDSEHASRHMDMIPSYCEHGMLRMDMILWGVRPWHRRQHRHRRWVVFC